MQQETVRINIEYKDGTEFSQFMPSRIYAEAYKEQILKLPHVNNVKILENDK